MAQRKRPRKNSSAKKPESLRAIYARFKREFSAADLQKYTVDEPLIPARQLLAELEKVQKQYDRKRKKA